MATAGTLDPHAGSVECLLESAYDLAALLTALQLREKEQRDQRAYCEASARGLKFMAQSGGKDATVMGWMFENAFREYRFESASEELHLKLPVAPLLSCLQIFSDRATLRLQYPSGPGNELLLVLQENGDVTECRVKTLLLDDVPAQVHFLDNSDAVRDISSLRPQQPDAWHLALAEFEVLEAPDVVLSISLYAAPQRAAEAGGHPQAQQQRSAAVVLRAQTITSDAEVEIPHESLDEFRLSAAAAAAGGVSHRYLLSSVLSSCLRAAKESKAVKVRFNSEGVMSVQFILRSKGQRDQLFCEALVCPLAGAAGGGGGGLAAPAPAPTPAPF
eukprot:TRINITY_DN14032_c0_g2_i1.p1 TRINITY_DN14032_c0_g2~~TRINITY_DN14032_c0_g2_i1.p1  ORF type:complete len:354 (-),score=77.30 TRINITY_DN14032_c0_g2_i1:58-1050(-)